MTDHHEEDELAPTQTAGYKVGEKKSLQEYETLDANDESLKKWKASLGLGKSAGKLLTPLTSLPHFFYDSLYHCASSKAVHLRLFDLSIICNFSIVFGLFFTPIDAVFVTLPFFMGAAVSSMPI
jgi:hypothetical protein